MQAERSVSIVTGGFGFSGRHIAHKVLLRGERVRTLTNHPGPGSTRHDRLDVAPLDLGDIQSLAQSMRGQPFFTTRTGFGSGMATLAIGAP